MRLLFDHQVFSDQATGGISRYFANLFREFSARHSITYRVAAGVTTNAHLRALPASPHACVSGIQMPAWVPRSRALAAINRLWLAWQAAHWKPDVYHATYYRLLARHSSAKRIFTVYDMIHEKFSDLISERDPTAARKRASLTQADGIICLSEQTREDLNTIMPELRAPIRVVHLGAPEWKPKRVASCDPNPYFLYVGKRSGYKDAALLFRAIADSPVLRSKTKTVCFGGGPCKLAEKRLLDELGLTEQVVFMSGSDEVLASLYEHASAYIQTSRGEGFGLPVLEAMTMRCPVVATELQVTTEIAEDAALYFPVGCSDDLAAQLEDVLVDSAKRQDLVEKGGRRAAEFTWRQTADQTTNFYREVTGDL